jgi:SAM-dependent methyltransferase
LEEGQPDIGKTCEICQNAAGNKIHLAREMMLGFRDVFQYLECDACGCLQLLDAPDDMGRYYPSNYNAFRPNEELPLAAIVPRLRNYFRKRRNQGVFNRRTRFDRLLARRYVYLQLEAFTRLSVAPQARILDVGCASGWLLLDLKELGYQNLCGVDRFIPRSIDYPNGVRVVKGGLEEFSGTTWDLIMFHHSFEHMANPLSVLRLAAELLAPGGSCLIRIPIVAWAWRHYGVHWGQLDAPRHLFLHSEKSFRLIAASVGLEVRAVNYDSNEFQFWVSELYSRDISLASLPEMVPPPSFSRSRLRRFRSQAAKLNASSKGDSAVFHLGKP